MKKDLTSGAPWRVILLFALPIMAGNLLQQLYNTADTIIVGNFQSQAALSSVGTCASLTMLFIAIAMGFSNGAGVYIAQKYGARDYDAVRLGASTAIRLMMTVGVCAAVVAGVFGRFVLKYVVAVPDSLLQMATTYFTVYAVGLIFQFGYNIVAATLRAIGDSRATLYFLLISSVLNILLDLLFVAVFKWGVAGAAIATDIAQAGSCIVAFVYMFKKYELLRFRRGEFRYDGAVAGRIVRFGLPMALQQVVVSCGFVFLQRLVNSFGEDMTASFTVASRVENYCHVPVLGFQNTMATYCGQNKGAGRFDRIRKGLWQALAMSLGITAVLSALIFLLRPQIIGLFGLSGQAMIYCAENLGFMSAAILIFSVYLPANGMFQGVGRTVLASSMALVCLGCRVAVAYLFNGAVGYPILWYSAAVAWGVAVVFCYACYFAGVWKKKLPQ